MDTDRFKDSTCSLARSELMGHGGKLPYPSADRTVNGASSTTSASSTRYASDRSFTAASVTPASTIHAHPSHAQVPCAVAAVAESESSDAPEALIHTSHTGSLSL